MALPDWSDIAKGRRDNDRTFCVWVGLLMTTYRLTGNTYPHRERLKELRGLYDGTAKNWRFDGLKPAQISKLSNIVGCMLVKDDDAREAPEPYDAGDFITRIDAKQNEPQFTADRKSVIYGDDQTYFNYFKDKNPKSFFGFSSLSEMVKFIEAIPREKRSGDRDQGFTKGGMGSKWCGSADMSEAIDLANNGWAAGTENAAQVLEFLDLENATQRRRAYSVAGGHVSVGRLLAGNPAHMVRRPKLPGHRAITLFVENTASAAINADMLIIRAAIVAAFADILESRGYSCTIVSVTMQGLSFYDGNPGAQTAVTIKHAGEKLNLNDVVFALGHPSFLRRFNFACVSQADELRRIWDSQGYPKSAFDDEMNRNEFYVPHLQCNLQGDNFQEIAKKMLPIIKPSGLPLELVI